MMSCKRWKVLLNMLIAGVLIEDLQLFSYYFLFVRYDLDYLVVTTVIIGTLIAVVAICAKNKSFWKSLVRWLMLHISCFLVMYFNASTGFSRWLLATYDGEVGSGTKNVIGLVLLFTYLAIFGNALIVILLRGVVFGIRKVQLRRKQ